MSCVSSEQEPASSGLPGLCPSISPTIRNTGKHLAERTHMLVTFAASDPSAFTRPDALQKLRGMLAVTIPVTHLCFSSLAIVFTFQSPEPALGHEDTGRNMKSFWAELELLWATILAVSTLSTQIAYIKTFV